MAAQVNCKNCNSLIFVKEEQIAAAAREDYGAVASYEPIDVKVTCMTCMHENVIHVPARHVKAALKWVE